MSYMRRPLFSCIGEAFILGSEKKQKLKREKLHLHYENLADGGLVK